MLVKMRPRTEKSESLSRTQYMHAWMPTTREASDYKRSIRLQEKLLIQDKQQLTNPMLFPVWGLEAFV